MNDEIRSNEENGMENEVLSTVSTVFASLGRGLVCLNDQFQVVHVSEGLDQVVGEGTAAGVIGKNAAEVFGEELFGSEGTLRQALLAGERREGWGATLDRGSDQSPRMVSLTVGPLVAPPGSHCDPRVAYISVVRPHEESEGATRSAPTTFSGMTSRSASMLSIFELIQHLEESDATVLITGDSGTGKELVARALHVHSLRRNGRFIAVNCAALPGELLESELFGHIRGAFSGAVRDREGRFDLANGGTLFLDEVGDLPLQLQVKLLRVLQERTFERVGESRSRTSDARIVAATNQDLREAISEGRFRDDLYYRLRVVPIHVPPLRDRREDIAPLAHRLLARVASRNGRSLILAPGALRVFLAYSWPGNVRELENALEYAVAVCRGQTIHETDLPKELLSASQTPESASTTVPSIASPELASPMEPTQSSAAEERERIRIALTEHRWRREPAAEALGMSRTTLWRKMREYGLLS